MKAPPRCQGKGKPCLGFSRNWMPREAVSCQCRKVESLDDCPSFESKLDPRYYHADVDGEQMCCRLSQGGTLSNGLAKAVELCKTEPV